MDVGMPIINCLSELNETKPLSTECKNTLEITKSVIQKMNTAPVTVVDLKRLNDTHIAASQTTSESHPPVWWQCPADFVPNDKKSNGEKETQCCSATLAIEEPRQACT